MGKYTEVVKGLPRLEQPRGERVEKLRLEYGQRGAAELALLYVRWRKIKDETEAVLKGHNEHLEAITGLLVGAYEEEGIATLKILDTGQSVSVQQEPYASVEDRDKLRDWVIKNGLENLMALHPQTLQSLTRQLLVDGQAQPDGVKVFVNSKLVLRAK